MEIVADDVFHAVEELLEHKDVGDLTNASENVTPQAGTAVLKLDKRTHSSDSSINGTSLSKHIDCFLNVGLPIATLFRVINLVDDNIVLLLAVGCDVESTETGLAGVLDAGQKVEYRLFLRDDTFLLLAAVGNPLGTEGL